MEWLSTKIDNVLTWIGQAFITLFTAITDWIKDLFVWLLDGVLSAIAALFEAIPVPSFMQGGLGALFSALPQPLIYLLVETGMVAGLGIIGAGVVFNLTRKALTLGQW